MVKFNLEARGSTQAKEHNQGHVPRGLWRWVDRELARCHAG